MEHEPRRDPMRDTILTISLIVLLGGIIVTLLVFVSMGVFAYVLAAVAIFALVGFLHYALWGYAMSQSTAGEREELRLREEQDHDHEPPARHSVRDLSRPRRPK